VFPRPMACVGAVLFVVLNTLFLCVSYAQGSSSAGTTTFIFDGNRMYAELDFVRVNGSIRRALAFVDMGSTSMVLRETLFNDLQLDQNKPLRFRVGGLSVEVPGKEVISETSKPRRSDLKVEAMLGAGILQRYQVVIDYQKRTLTLAEPQTLKPHGIPMPCHVSAKTGLIGVDASIDGKSYPVTIDNGSAYTWFRQTTAKHWLGSHPDWERGIGAVGPSNMMMSGDTTETEGILVRIPEVSVGPLTLKDVGALAAGPSKNFPGNLDLFDWYSQKNVGPVIGWIGGNVLKGYRLTIDYPNQMTYWLKQSDSEVHDLDQVGLTLRSEHGEFVVAAVASKNGTPAVEGVLPGDRLVRVGDLELGTATWGQIYESMHGKPGETRSLVLERNGNQLTVAAKVMRF